MNTDEFDINRPRDGTSKSAMLPSLKSLGVHPLFGGRIRDVNDYLSVMHAAIDEAQTKIAGHLMETYKALGVVPPQAFSYSTMSFMPDPANHGLMQWPGLNAESLRKIAKENVSPQIIIRQRADDIARYADLSTSLTQPGWRIGMRDGSETPNVEDKKQFKEIEHFLFNCSMDGDRDPRDRDAHLINPFEHFLRGFIDDSLTFDGWGIWTDMDKSGVNAFANLPAGMIKLAVPTRGVRGNPRHFAALVDETGNPVKPLTRQEFVWRIRNVRQDPSVGSYGWPEIEMAISLIQAFTGGIELNKQTFTNSSIPNGMLVLKGDYFNQEQIDALAREWTNMKRGMSKLWGMPVLAMPEDGEVEVIEFMDLKGHDVRYKDHMNLMMGLCCLMWRFPIRRLGMFVSGNHRDNAPPQDAALEMQQSDDPGLAPLLSFVENTINPYFVWPRWPKYKFIFTSKSPKEDARQFQERALARTYGEARTDSDLQDYAKLAGSEHKDLAEIMSLCPTNPVLASVFQALALEKLRAELGTAPGMGAGNPAKPGASMLPQKDPAESQGHGHLGGIRRDSRAERERAQARKPH